MNVIVPAARGAEVATFLASVRPIIPTRQGFAKQRHRGRLCFLQQENVGLGRENLLRHQRCASPLIQQLILLLSQG